jgi:3-deoxy-manno-octulosonate cytidylyltransferase (CMP-KDO synthetase)
MRSNTVAIIPSRLESSRIEKKALVDICGMPMVIHVMKRVQMSSCVSDTYVATDSQEIADVVREYGGKAILTSKEHKNGTERVCEAIQDINADTFVICMGDEALLNPDHIQKSVDTFYQSDDASGSILVTEFTKENSPSDFKVVVNPKNEIMYISRGDIPCSARNKVDFRLKAYHIMTFSRKVLEKYTEIGKSPMEKIEDHEYLRLIENGYKIVAKKVDSASISVDVPEDLEYVRRVMKNDNLFKIYRDLV